MTSGTIQSINFPNQDYAIGARIPANKTYFEAYFFIESLCGPIKLTFNTFNVQPGGDVIFVSSNSRKCREYKSCLS
jgi:hypothetical protein